MTGPLAGHPGPFLVILAMRQFSIVSPELSRPLVPRAAYPPWFGNMGSVQFDHGARTVRVLPGLDEAEGRMVAEWLAQRLPAGAVTGV